MCNICMRFQLRLQLMIFEYLNVILSSCFNLVMIEEIICCFSYFNIIFPSAQLFLLLAPSFMSITSTDLSMRRFVCLFAITSLPRDSWFKANHRWSAFYPAQDMFVKYIDQLIKFKKIERMFKHWYLYS
jgi:hypothetical protein